MSTASMTTRFALQSSVTTGDLVQLASVDTAAAAGGIGMTMWILIIALLFVSFLVVIVLVIVVIVARKKMKQNSVIIGIYVSTRFFCRSEGAFQH